MTELEKLTEAREWLKKRFAGFVPLIVITAGSGLGWLANLLKGKHSCKFSSVPHCPVARATGHAGRLCWGKLAGIPVVILQGRVHYYEGFTIHEVVFLTRLMIMMAKGKLFFILTHATGAVTRNLEAGDIVAEFQPMGDAYSPRLLALVKRCALKVGVTLHRGVSYFKPGRTYESEAEGEMMRRVGADVATMSTIPEVTAAVHMGVKRDEKGQSPCGVTAEVEVLDLALVTDMVHGLRQTSVPLSHQEVQMVANQMKRRFGRLVIETVAQIARLCR